MWDIVGAQGVRWVLQNSERGWRRRQGLLRSRCSPQTATLSSHRQVDNRVRISISPSSLSASISLALPGATPIHLAPTSYRFITRARFRTPPIRRRGYYRYRIYTHIYKCTSGQLNPLPQFYIIWNKRAHRRRFRALRCVRVLCTNIKYSRNV